jgi:hypothetical protein
MLNCCFDKLPEEIIEEILSYTSFEDARCVNKQFKDIKDKYELNYGKCLIIKKEMVCNYISRGPSFYTLAWISDNRYSLRSVDYFRARRMEDDIYMHKSRIKNIYKGNWYNIDNYKSPYKDKKINIFENIIHNLYYPYQKFQLSSSVSSVTYLPTFDNIVYFLSKHPLATSKAFINKSILKTITHYKEFIKNFDAFDSVRNELLSEYDTIITTEAGITTISDIDTIERL